MDNEPFCFDLNRYHEDVKGDAMEDVEFQRENEGDENDEVTQETLNKPEVGMTFDTVDDILEYYQKYGNEKGFPVKIRSSRKDDNGVTRYITLTCCREGKARSKGKNVFKMQPICNTNCNAKICVVLCPDRKWKLNTVFLDHNHVVSPGKAQYFKQNREVPPSAKRQLVLHDQSGIQTSKSYYSLVNEAGGYENVPYLMKDAYNIVEKERRLRLGYGDVEAVQNYFIKMHENNSNFFSSIDFGDDGRLRNLFWADARSRAAYEEFGDVITFDTTYLTNKYDMPFAPFVGVNHHGHSILFGCGLISNEDTKTFTWLFSKWLSCMKSRAPNAIITDQDRAMKNAIEIVFPKTTRHRWCLWHIMKKIPEKLKGYGMEYQSIKSCMKSIVYESLTTAGFETSWIKFVEKFSLEKNEWLRGLFTERHRWVPVFVKDTFWAGMSTTQRSESMNAFFDGYVNSKTTLKQFVEQYENALRTKVEKEKKIDSDTFRASILCITKYKIEEQFQKCYTNEKFLEVQDEMKGKLYCTLSRIEENGDIERYEVKEDLVGVKQQDVTFTVMFNPVDCDVKCICRLFEFRGILCRHCLTVLIYKKFEIVPEKYIIRQWRKDVDRCHTKIKILYSDWAMNPESERRDRLCNAFYKGVELAIESEDTTQMAMGWIESFINELKNNAGKNANSQLTSLTRRVIDCNSKGSATLLDPLSVRRKGRPCSNRIVGRTEKYVQQQHKKQNSKKDDEIASKLPHGSEGISSYFNSLREKEIESHIPHCSQDVSSCLDANHDQLSIQFDASRGIPSQFAVSHNDFPMP